MEPVDVVEGQRDQHEARDREEIEIHRRSGVLDDQAFDDVRDILAAIRRALEDVEISFHFSTAMGFVSSANSRPTATWYTRSASFSRRLISTAASATPWRPSSAVIASTTWSADAVMIRASSQASACTSVTRTTERGRPRHPSRRRRHPATELTGGCPRDRVASQTPGEDDE